MPGKALKCKSRKYGSREETKSVKGLDVSMSITKHSTQLRSMALWCLLSN